MTEMDELGVPLLSIDLMGSMLDRSLHWHLPFVTRLIHSLVTTSRTWRTWMNVNQSVTQWVTPL